ncbi:MAG: MoaD/ThiS family protein [Saprospiraceae bacterium]
MPTVNFTSALKRFYPELKPMSLSATDVRSLLEEIEKQHSGITKYLLDDRGVLRQHVNIFVNEKMIVDREGLSDELETNSEVYIMQALSGG